MTTGTGPPWAERERAWSRIKITAAESACLTSLGAELRRLRLAAGLSQTELARRAELSTSGYVKIEGGARRTRASTLRRLAMALQPEAPSPVLSALVLVAGPALAEESAYRDRVDRRRARRQLRRSLISPRPTTPAPRAVPAVSPTAEEMLQNMRRVGAAIDALVAAEARGASDTELEVLVDAAHEDLRERGHGGV